MKRVVRKYVRTKQCGCPDNAPTDCRFTTHFICPNFNNPLTKKRWLWAIGYVDIETGEAPLPGEEIEIVSEESQEVLENAETSSA